MVLAFDQRVNPRKWATSIIVPGATKRSRDIPHLSKRDDTLAGDSGGQIKSALTRIQKPMRRSRQLGGMARLASLILVPSAFFVSTIPAQAGQVETIAAEAALPESPEPQTPASSHIPRPPCPAQSNAEPNWKAASAATPNSGIGPATGALTGIRPAIGPCTPPHANWYSRFVDGPQNKLLTPKDKAWLAARNMVDPFNTITILGEAGISVGYDSHSPYWPGMAGYGRYVGVSFTQDLTGEFFGTFLIPSVAHQDPHYHRMPQAKIPRRVLHAMAQVVWTQGDDGKGMPNYANLVGFGIDDEISNLYVPGRETNVEASMSRYGIAMASAPIGNFVDEFLPDVARHIHVQIVIIQRVINQVARSEMANTSQ